MSKKSFYHSCSPVDRLERRYHHLKAKVERTVENHGAYGYRRIQVALREHYGEVVNHKLLRKLLRLWGFSLPRKIRRPKPGVVQRVLTFLEARANLLFQVTPKRAMEVVVSDITEVRYGGGTAYLCVHLDKVAKQVYGWSLSLSADARLVTASFKAAVDRIRALLGRMPHMIVHQDRGTAYTSHGYVRTLLDHPVRPSFSRTGEPGDNTVNEAFFSRFKEELRELLGEARTFEQLHAMVAEAIAYYNRHRYHSTLNYRTPSAFVTEELTSCCTGD